ncbi:MAG TPA: right-handed parallel beta-helix repeat-containing protein, partial [Halioglobus sp.]
MKYIKHVKKPAIASLLVGLLTVPGMASAANYYVHAGVGKNTNSGTQPTAAFADLAYAMPKLRAGDTLHVRAGKYTATPAGGKLSNGTQTSPITVKPYLSEKPVISFTSKLTLSNNRAWWVFDNLTFQNSQLIAIGASSDTGGCSFATDIAIINSRFQHSSYQGINLQCGKRILVAGNIFDNMRARVAGTDVHAIVLSDQTEDVFIGLNTFRDIGADGIQLGRGSNNRNVNIVDNTFEVIRPYVYRDLNGQPTADTQRFGNVGENGIDIKAGPGPINVTGNTIRGFRPAASGQDVSGSMGVGLVIQQMSSGINVSKNRFIDSNFHMRIVGDGAPTSLPNRDVDVTNNIFDEVPAYTGSGQVPTGLDVVNVTGVRVYNNVFYNLKSAGKRLLRLQDVREVSLQNNLFHNGTVLQPPATYVMDVYADHNAWSKIGGAIPSDWKGLRDLTLTDPAIDWTNWKPKAGSPMIDKGMNVELPDDYYGVPITGVAPEI